MKRFKDHEIFPVACKERHVLNGYMSFLEKCAFGFVGCLASKQRLKKTLVKYEKYWTLSIYLHKTGSGYYY